MLDSTSRLLDFPSLAGNVYLNTAAEGIPPRSMQQALNQYFHDKALGMDGRERHFATETSVKGLAARLLQLKAEEIGLCSCSAEAINLLRLALELNAEDEVVLNDLEFPSGATPWVQSPAVVKLWRSHGGELHTETLRPLLSERTRLILTSLVSFYNGHRLDWDKFIKEVRDTAPSALVAVDITQAVGRIPINVPDADFIFTSTHKWLLGPHGGCIIGIPERSAAKIVSKAGGWYHLKDAFGSDRFERAESYAGAKGFGTGMPGFPSIYALKAALDCILSIGVENIAQHADPLTEALAAELSSLGVQLLSPYRREQPSGILAFQHPEAAAIHQHLRHHNIHVMYQAGRLRLAVHGYNTAEDIATVTAEMRSTLQ